VGALLALGLMTAGCELVAGLRHRTQASTTDGGEETGGASPGGTGGSVGSGGAVTGGTGGSTGAGGGGMGGAVDAGVDSGPSSGSCPPWGRLGTCEARYLTDASNCCVAGRSCGGGTCAGGKCQPTLIAAQVMSDLEDIQVAGNYVVVAGGCEKRTRRYNKNGGGEFLLPLDADGECISRLGIRNDQVYWIEWDGPYLQAAPIDASAQARHVAKLPIALTDVTLRQMAIDDTRAYWTTSEPSGVWFAPLDGTGGPAKAVATQQSIGLTTETVIDAFGVAVDGAYLYFTDREQHNVRRRALATLDQNLPAEQVATGGTPRHIAADGEHIYWVTEDGFVMSHARAPGGTATMLAANQTGAFSIIVDDHYVYWTRNLQNGTVSRVPKEGAGAAEDLATGQKGPLGLAQECGTIYWTNQNEDGPGEVARITK
jgi:hypothetical protein